MKYSAKDMPSLRFDRDTGEGTIDFPLKVGAISVIAGDDHAAVFVTESGCRWVLRSVETEHDAPHFVGSNDR